MLEEWPPIQSDLEQAIETFDSAAAKGFITVICIDILENAEKEWFEFRQKNPQIRFPHSDELLREIRSRKNLHLSEILWKSSLEAESMARRIHLETHSDPTKMDDAISQMRSALESQNRINNELPNCDRVNYPRSAELQSWIYTLEAEPLYRQFLDTRAEALKYQENKDWNASIAELRTAISIQSDINHQFPDAPQADVTEIMRLDDLVMEAEAQLLYSKSVENLEKSKNYMDAGKEDIALNMMSEALDIQNTINLKYPHTSVFSKTRSETISAQLQTIRAEETVDRIIQLNSDLDLLLSVGMTDKISLKLADLTDTFRILDDEYPLYPNPPLKIRNKVQYLKKILENLASIAAILNQLKTYPVPLNGKPSKLSELVPQQLYLLVMGKNPSRTQNKDSPVDSVSWEDVMDFCEKLSYITTLEIQIPNLEAIRQLPNLNPTLDWQWVKSEDSMPKSKAMVVKINNPDDAAEKDIFYRSRTLGFRVLIPASQ